MNKRLKNRWDVQVVFNDYSYRSTNVTDRLLTAENVADELEEFVQRIRQEVSKQKRMAALPVSEEP